MGLYSRYILPRLSCLSCSSEAIRTQRAKVVPLAQGVVLELGFGAGLNLPHYDASKVSKLFALEPAQGMRALARKEMASAPLPIEMLYEPAEQLSLPPGSVDTVVVTYSLCTIPDAVAALERARQVLKADGRLLFCEHGLAPDAHVHRWQVRIEPIWRIIGGGCHLTRDIPKLIRAGGFTIERLDTRYLPGAPKWSGFNFWGTARSQ
jgi:ubiquinone/menaquinone biosynthesis C-methylase UbiE